jgi:hypothetical protein
MNTHYIIGVALMAVALSMALPTTPDSVVPELAQSKPVPPVKVSKAIKAQYEHTDDEQIVSDTHKEDEKVDLTGSVALSTNGTDGMTQADAVNTAEAETDAEAIAVEEQKAQIEKNKNDAENKAEMEKADAEARLESMKEMAAQFPTVEDDEDTHVPKWTYKKVWADYQVKQAKIKADAEAKAAADKVKLKKFQEETAAKAKKMSSCMAGNTQDC